MPQDAESAPPRRSWLRRLLNRLEVDRAVFFAVVLRAWQSLAGVVTALLIITGFTERVQGYYYTFASLIALQTFFELGLSVVVVNICSHQWAELRLDEEGKIAGDSDARSRLISVGRLLFKWYGVACLLFIGVVSTVGWYFLSRQTAGDVDWQAPWWALTIITGMLLWTLPFNALLEGCHQVASVNRFRLLQAIFANGVIWSVILLRGNLWAVVGAAAARVLCELYFLCVRYRAFFRPFWQPPETKRINWRGDIWPQQWRIALGGIFFYFAFYLFVPVMLEYHGPETAGRMGMTWALIMALQAAALAWVQTRVPRFGSLIARQDYRELDRIFFRLTAISIAILIGLYGAFFLGLYLLNHQQHPWAARLLPPLPTALFMAAVLVQHVLSCQDFYVRAHRREPYMLVLITSNIAVGLAVWLLGWKYGPLGAAAGLLGVNLLYKAPLQTLVWSRCRRLWHAPAEEPA